MGQKEDWQKINLPLDNVEVYIARSWLTFLAPSQGEAEDFVIRHTDTLAAIAAKWSYRECQVSWPGATRPYKVPASMCLKGESMLGLVNEQWMRVADEIYNERRPAFLVSMREHQNFMVNEAACELMECDSDTLLRRKLAKFWTPPGEVKPISYDLQLPPHLENLHQHLRQQSELISHRFSNWKPAGDESDAHWVQWNDDIKYREIEGKPFRLMIVNHFRERLSTP